MAALRRERIRLYLWTIASSALIGVLYNVVQMPWTRIVLGDLWIGLVDGALIAAGVGLFEMLLLPSGRLRRLNQLPFGAVVLLKTVLYSAIVLAALTRAGTKATSDVAIVFSL